jgi:hypothetical protein
LKLFGWFRKKEFPLPEDRHMTLDGIFKYWRRMPGEYRAECEWYLYRMDPAKAPVTSMLRFRATEAQVLQDKKAFGRVPPDAESMMYLAHDKLTPSLEWWDTQDPDMERRAYFLVRIMRRWRVMGAERHEEIGVAPFDIRPDSMPQLASSRTGVMI